MKIKKHKLASYRSFKRQHIIYAIIIGKDGESYSLRSKYIYDQWQKHTTNAFLDSVDIFNEITRTRASSTPKT